MFTSHEPFQLPSQERERLQQIVRTTTLSAGLVRRARVLLLLAGGVSLRQIQAQTGMSPRRTQHWKRSWLQQGLDGLLDAPRAGRPKKLTVAKEAAILAATEEHPPGSTTHWSTRRLARRMGLSNVTVMRVWHKAGLCIDEKTAIQALDRTQPVLPMQPQRLERQTVEYVRHGTVSLFSALEVHSGKVVGRCVPRHTSEEFVSFLNEAVAGHRRKAIHVYGNRSVNQVCGLLPSAP